MFGNPDYPTDRTFRTHCISVNCRAIHRCADWENADWAWKDTKASMNKRDVARWDHEFTDGTHHTVARAEK